MARGVPIIDKERCKGCGLCIANCPKNILEKAEDYNGQGAYYTVCVDADACIGCGACAVMCPDAAIVVERPAVAV